MPEPLLSCGLAPLVSVVTPSFNSGDYLEETIQSVLSQDYPHLEYIVMDGGSTDATPRILEKYRHCLTSTSEPDNGTADAINRGLKIARGSIVAWLSADDVYSPGAISHIVDLFERHPEAAVIYGEGQWVDPAGRPMRRYPTRSPYDPAMFRRDCCLCQPSCFIRRDALRQAGWLDSNFKSAFDYDLWVRLSRLAPFVHTPQILAMSRMHPSNISLSRRDTMFRESMTVLRRYYGYVPVQWVYGYLSYLRQRTDQFYDPLRHSTLIYLASLPAGLLYNGLNFPRYCREWLKTVLSRLRTRPHNPS